MDYDDLEEMLHSLLLGSTEARYEGRIFQRLEPVKGYSAWFWECTPGWMKLIEPEDWRQINDLGSRGEWARSYVP